jgi:hypothetical protein
MYGNMDLIGWLGRQAGLIKAAESFVLPPRKVTPRSKTVKPTDDIDFDQQGHHSQQPQSYGLKRKSR